MEVRLYPSDEDYPLFNFVADMIAKYTNAYMFTDLQSLTEEERALEVSIWKAWMEELMH